MSSSSIITSKFQRPASQATSVKAEPGSATASLASASVKRVCTTVCARQFNVGSVIFVIKLASRFVM